jgi:hypothetical protein
MNQLESVYYAATRDQMSVVLDLLNKGCNESLCCGTVTDVKISGGFFVENMSDKLKVVVQNEGIKLLIKQTGKTIPQFNINDKMINANIVEPNIDDISEVMDTIIPKLGQLKIAHGNIKIDEQIQKLEHFIETSYNFFENIKKSSSFNSDTIGKIHIKPRDRLNMIKKIKELQMNFKQECNKLKLLKATVEDSSAKQAAFLTGITKKYSGKAILNSKTIQMSPQEVLSQIVKLQDDLQKYSGKNTNERSIFSLNNPLEQIKEWLSVLNDIKNEEFNNIYSLLVCFGFSGYPVKFEHNNAVQMDPFQTRCLNLEPYLIDSSSLLLAEQLNHTLKSPSNKTITDCLILVQPSAPELYRIAMKSPIYNYIASITLCRDLYMCHPKMAFSMHAHSLPTAVNKYYKTNSTVYLDLSIRILYSIRKCWGSILCKESDNINLFNHWWKQLNTITQSEVDHCNHPVQLLLIFGACDIDFDNKGDYVTPLLNFLNEMLSRILKIKLMGLIKESRCEIKNHAIREAQKLLGIFAQNSPKPNPDLLVDEPPLSSIRESCAECAVIKTDNYLRFCDTFQLKADSIHKYVNKILLPYLRTFHFVISIHRHIIESNSSWNKIVDEIEDVGAIPETLLNSMAHKLEELRNMDIFQYINITNAEHAQQVSATMFLQAFLHHDSKSRYDINHKNVLDPNTLKEIVIDLRMKHYLDACEIKRNQRQEMIGDVMFEKAINCSESDFEKMIGKHTHGLLRKEFWALLAASKTNQIKKDIFLSKSNDTVIRCFN